MPKKIIKSFLTTFGNLISRIIEWFYPPFSRFFTLTFFKYGVCGASNMVFDWVLFFFVYNFIVAKQLVYLKIVTLSPHVASLFITFPITLLSGFLLQKYVTFTASNLRGRYQLFRYFIIVIVNLLINYFGLKLLVDGLAFYPTPSKMIITFFTVMVSYFAQKIFIFKVK